MNGTTQRYTPTGTGLTRRDFAGIISAAACALALSLRARPAEAVSTSESEGEAPENPVYEMPLMLFFLAPEQENETVRLILGLTLELDDPTAGDDVHEAMPLITDRIWDIFSRTTASQLAGEAGMNRLRSSILQVVTDAVGYGRIRDVLFREFLTQRAR